MSDAPFRWTIAAPFIHAATDRWLTAFVPNPDSDLRFQVVPADYTHDRSRKITGAGAWRDYARHGNATWHAAQGERGSSGIVTCFPQLAITVGLRKRLARSDIPLVAWTFNLGKVYPGARRMLARSALTAVNRFIVHSRSEIKAYSEWLQLPPERFTFVPLQRATSPITLPEDLDKPFLLSMGSAQRDYRLLFRVLGELGYSAVVVAGPHAVAGLTVPSNVELRSGLSADECFALVQRARLSVIPVANQDTASGQVTLLDAMVYARATIITACPASVDYVVDGVDAMLVRPSDHDGMKRAIQTLWEDAALRASLGANARRACIEKFSDEAIGRVMGSVLNDVVGSR